MPGGQGGSTAAAVIVSKKGSSVRRASAWLRGTSDWRYRSAKNGGQRGDVTALTPLAYTRTLANLNITVQKAQTAAVPKPTATLSLRHIP